MMSTFRLLPLLSLIIVMFTACSRHNSPDLASRLGEITDSAPGQVGIAVILSMGDTVTVGCDSVRYPLMSVFKLHQSIALGRVLDESGVGLDTIVTIARRELNPETWSPLLVDYPEGDVSLPLTDLLDYLLLQSDNNVSNILFDRFCHVAMTDSIIRNMTGDNDFKLTYTEHEMQLDHAKAYCNWSSPKACAALMASLFTDSLLSTPKQQFIISALKRCETGRERIPAAFTHNDSVTIAHRTGSGYINEHNEIVAVNDVAHIILPDGRNYTLAILVKDYSGTQEDAERLIARISSEVYAYIKYQR